MRGKRRSIYTGMLAFGSAVAAAPALAQEAFDLENWDYDTVYDGWSAERLMDEADVHGTNGEEIGSIENLLLDDSGRVVAVIAQVGGFLDIGDTHLAAPWDEVAFDGEDVTVPVTEDNIERYSIFADELFTRRDVGSLQSVDDDLVTSFSFWKATDLIDDYAVLETGAGYGYINDLVFGNDGMLQAVVVDVDYGRRGAGAGYYAYPWYGYGYDGYAWEPGLDSYVLPFDEDEISDFTLAFDYGELNGDFG